MHKIVSLILLFVSVNLFAQNDAAKDTAATSVITAVGKPDGKKTTVKINKEGGGLRSSDGIVELIIPAGAVSKKTDISIQPITNLMTNGDGKAYRLEPSGIQFKQPVQLIFHYDEEETKDSMQLLLGISMQDDKGQWYSLNKTELDTIAKTISGSINHFSDWGKFEAIKLYPSYARLKVKKSHHLEIDLVTSEGDDNLLTPLDNLDAALLSALKKRKIPWTSTWEATSGNIARESKTTATYTAPATVPAQNPVAITANLNGPTYTIKVKGELIPFKELELVSNILVFDDAYEVTMVSEIQGMSGTCLGAATYKDTGSFVISLNGNEARIIERVNRNTSAFLDYSGGRCWGYTILKSGTGNIHIAGTPVIKVTPPAGPGKSATIEISFRRGPSIFPLFQVTCKCDDAPGGPTTGTNAQGVAMMAGILPAQPTYIKFEAKEGEQTIIKQGEPGDPIYTRFTVTQLKED
ncbi:MAG: hypothetical protein ABI675_09250 [Chitinophagaceae bacterium]